MQIAVVLHRGLQRIQDAKEVALPRGDRQSNHLSIGTIAVNLSFRQRKVAPSIDIYVGVSINQGSVVEKINKVPAGIGVGELSSPILVETAWLAIQGGL